MGICPCFGSRRGKKLKEEIHEVDSSTSTKCKPVSTLPLSSSVQTLEPIDGPVSPNTAQTFSFRELATATNNFREESFIGEGGFGAVFRGVLESTGQAVAVKQLDKTGQQGEKEFLVEVLMLSLLRHPNLVHLIGYCAEGDQRLLVYDFMPLGCLEDHLHDPRPDQEPLDWNTRMMIAVGAAKGLEYLHNEADPPVIYRDLKAANILLGEDFQPKLSDFGLAKFGPTADKSHVSTRVMGTHGYCAPEYAESGKLTMKSDIFSFGVVLLELVTGRRALDVSRGTGKQFLVDWAHSLHKNRRSALQLADPKLRGRFPESMIKKFLEVALMCVQKSANARPSISEVVLALNYLEAHKYEERIEAKTSRVENPEELNSPKETARMLNNTARERAVAEAKLWGENWREKRRGIEQNSYDEYY